MDNPWPILIYSYELILSGVKLLRISNPEATINDVVTLIEKALEECKKQQIGVVNGNT